MEVQLLPSFPSSPTPEASLGARFDRLRQRRVGQRIRAFAATLLTLGASLAAIGATPQPAAAATPPVVSAGNNHTCVLMPNGTVFCWGFNHYGQLGNSAIGNSAIPVQAQGPAGATQVAAGQFHSCALASGVAWCWGSNAFGAVGNGNTNDRHIPTKVKGGLTFTQIAAGGTLYAPNPPTHADFTCGVTNLGAADCWGYGKDGQLGNGTNQQSLVPVQVMGLDAGVRQVALGASHACALMANGAVKCWGTNHHGELGNNSTTGSNVPVPVTGLSSGVVAISAGFHHTCALLSGGAMQCWGANANGEIGDATTAQRLVPTPVIGLSSGVQQISAGGYHTCALGNFSVVRILCWGDGNHGDLGDGKISPHNVLQPQLVFGMTASGVGTPGPSPVQVAAGGSHTCAVVSTGQVECWGFNNPGSVGDGTSGLDRGLPTLVIGLTDGPQQVSEGQAEGCAITQSLDVSCWGSRDGTDFQAHTSAQPVTSLTGKAAQTSAGEIDACVLSVAGALRCWGTNGNGEDGDGTTSPNPTPQPVTNMASGVVSVSTGEDACSVVQPNQLFCWGYGHLGELGNNSNQSSDVPVQVFALGKQIAGPAFDQACAIGTNAAALCWGRNGRGELGDGTTNDSKIPVKVNGLPATPVQIAVGGSLISNSFSCAVLVTGRVFCWGDNQAGELGNGSTANRSLTPVKVQLSAGAKEVVTGTQHACALLTTGDVQCWGDNSFGQLGNGSSASESNVPVTVSNLGSQAIQISSDDVESTCALLATSPQIVQCWGRNGADELGDGQSGGFSNTPQPVLGL
jgi:alpha-tubulin suppressor-like RCC1 family protein